MSGTGTLSDYGYRLRGLHAGEGQTLTPVMHAQKTGHPQVPGGEGQLGNGDGLQVTLDAAGERRQPVPQGQPAIVLPDHEPVFLKGPDQAVGDGA